MEEKLESLRRGEKDGGVQRPHEAIVCNRNSRFFAERFDFLKSESCTYPTSMTVTASCSLPPAYANIV